MLETTDTPIEGPRSLEPLGRWASDLAACFFLSLAGPLLFPVAPRLSRSGFEAATYPWPLEGLGREKGTDLESQLEKHLDQTLISDLYSFFKIKNDGKTAESDEKTWDNCRPQKGKIFPSLRRFQAERKWLKGHRTQFFAPQIWYYLSYID